MRMQRRTSKDMPDLLSPHCCLHRPLPMRTRTKKAIAAFLHTGTEKRWPNMSISTNNFKATPEKSGGILFCFHGPRQKWPKMSVSMSGPYCCTVRLYCTVLFDTAILLYCTAELYCSTVLRYCTALLYYCTVPLYYTYLLLCSTAPLYHIVVRYCCT